jgi:hypothetical protein
MLDPAPLRRYHDRMDEQSANNSFFIDSLNHPLAGPIRKLLHRDGRRELGQILIDDE